MRTSFAVFTLVPPLGLFVPAWISCVSSCLESNSGRSLLVSIALSPVVLPSFCQVKWKATVFSCCEKEICFSSLENVATAKQRTNSWISVVCSVNSDIQLASVRLWTRSNKRFAAGRASCTSTKDGVTFLSSFLLEWKSPIWLVRDHSTVVLVRWRKQVIVSSMVELAGKFPLSCVPSLLASIVDLLIDRCRQEEQTTRLNRLSNDLPIKPKTVEQVWANAQTDRWIVGSCISSLLRLSWAQEPTNDLCPLAQDKLPLFEQIHSDRLTNISALRSSDWRWKTIVDKVLVEENIIEREIVFLGASLHQLTKQQRTDHIHKQDKASELLLTRMAKDCRNFSLSGSSHNFLVLSARKR